MAARQNEIGKVSSMAVRLIKWYSKQHENGEIGSMVVRLIEQKAIWNAFGVPQTNEPAQARFKVE